MSKTKEEQPKETRKKEKNHTLLKSIFKNPWRLAFITLVAVLVGFISVIAFRISTPRMTYDAKLPVIETREKPILDINMKKDQVNNVINFFLEDAMKESGVDYSFVLENQALVDGNVQLKAKSLSVGALSVPIPAMINYIASTTDLPNWIELDPDQQLINLHLNKFQLDNGMTVRAKKINLIDDEITFSLYLPKEKTKKK